MTFVVRSKHELIAAYKGILRDYIEQRPSGLRQKIAEALGTHKSFVSQITNPADPTPIPARHLEAIIDICHLANTDRTRFLAVYNAAHPRRATRWSEGQRHYKTLHIRVPVIADAGKQEALEDLIRDTVRRLCALLEDK